MPTGDASHRRQIMRQIEFYLSESNLRRDSFFRQEAEKRSDHGILVELLLNCRRLQQMQVTPDLLVRCLKKSDLVRLSDDGHAVVRIHPLSDLGPPEKRTVLVTGIPRWLHDPVTSEYSKPLSQPSVQTIHEACSTSNADPSSNQLWILMDWLHDVFGEFGRVLYISIPHYHSSSMFRGFAFVEFSTRKEAKMATKGFMPSEDTELWFTPPDPSAGTVTQAAWIPRMAAKASFRPEDMLARRYIWRCCSRKNKQVVCAFRHLRAAGYRAPNPCDREYELITLGSCSDEVRTQHLRECYGKPLKARLHVFRHSQWEFWKSKFYTWLRSWVERMNKKTDELSLDAEQDSVVQTNDALESLPSSESKAHVVALPIPQSLSHSPTQSVVDTVSNNFATQTDSLRLPKNYVPGTVVMVFWPSSAVSDFDQAVPLLNSSEDAPPIPERALSLTRRVRLSIERYLSRCELIDEVAHFDSQPNDLTLSSVLSASGTSSELHSDLYPVFIRMKSASSAHQLCEYLQTIVSSPNTHPINGTSFHAEVLLNTSEKAYWSAVSSSAVGAAERRRLIQQRRRKRKKQSLNHIKPDERPVPAHSYPKRLAFSSGDQCTLSQHIVFDE